MRFGSSSETRHPEWTVSRWINTRKLAGQPARPLNPIASSELSSPTQPASRHPERQWQDQTAGDGLRGGQDRSTSGRDDSGTNLRSGLLRHVVWLPPGSLLPPGVKCARSDHRHEESELDPGRGHCRASSITFATTSSSSCCGSGSAIRRCCP